MFESVIGLELSFFMHEKIFRFKLDEILSNMWCLYVISMVVYCSGHYHMVTSSSVTLYMMLPFAFVSLLMHVRKNGTRLPRHSGLFLLFCIFTAATSMLANYPSETIYSLISVSVLFFTAFAISEQVEWNKFRKLYIDIMLAVSVVSLVLYFTVNIAKMQIPFSHECFIGTESYTGNYLFAYRTIYSVRNQGLFWEPGLFAAYLILALVLHILYESKISILRVILITVTVLTTQSSAGIILLIIVALLLILRHSCGMGKIKQGMIVCFGIGISLFALSQNKYISAKWLVGIQDAIEKILGQSVNVVSRQNSPLINLKIFTDYPIFGAGYQNATNIYVNLRNTLGTVDSQTSTTTYHLAAIGIAGMVFLMVALIGILHLKKFNLASRILLLILFFSLINVEPYSGLLIYYILLFYLVKQYDIPK